VPSGHAGLVADFGSRRDAAAIVEFDSVFSEVGDEGGVPMFGHSLRKIGFEFKQKVGAIFLVSSE